MPATRFACEPLTQSLWDEVAPLLVDHYREVARYQDIELAPDLGAYAAAVAAGNVRVYTARQANLFSDRGTDLVGYALFFVRNAPHYRHSKQAAMDVCFVHEGARGVAGIRFIKFWEEQLAHEGVQLIMPRAKLDPRHSLHAILLRMGYEAVDVTLCKRLDQAEPAWDDVVERSSATTAAV